VEGREILFATHGFNVSYRAGIEVLSQLELDLALPPSFSFVGILWPGDWWIPAVNYPSEADDAVACGRGVARFANDKLGAARAISFLSHSLGGRLVLEATRGLARPAREVCVLAAAVDDECLGTAQYAAARQNAERISVLASRSDVVLRFAYRIGDFLSDLLWRDDDSPWNAALGYHGPRPAGLDHVAHGQISDQAGYGHGDYLRYPNATDAKTGHVTGFVRETLTGRPRSWP
jgi:esterase/lipase superfamily enzyme